MNDKFEIYLSLKKIFSQIHNGLLSYNSDIQNLVNKANQINPNIFYYSTIDALSYQDGQDYLDIIRTDLFNEIELYNYIITHFKDYNNFDDNCDDNNAANHNINLALLNDVLKLDNKSIAIVQGDSMINSNIDEGDMILFDLNKENLIIDNNPISVYIIRFNNQIFIKHLVTDKEIITVKSSNKKYDDINIEKDKISIVGKYISTIYKKK